MTYLGIIPFLPILNQHSGNGLVIEVNNSGDVIGSLQSDNGKIELLSQITLGEKHAYLVSPLHDKIWEIERDLL